MRPPDPRPARPRRPRPRAAGFATACALAGVLAPAVALPQGASEYRVKAAFLYNFALYTEWPDGVGPTINVCLHGGDPFGADIDALKDKKVGDRRLAVLRNVPLGALTSCQVVFVTPAATAALPRVVERLRDQPALVVADTPGGARAGAALNLPIADGRVAFEANVAAAQSAHLKLSSRLLRLAVEVVP